MRGNTLSFISRYSRLFSLFRTVEHYCTQLTIFVFICFIRSNTRQTKENEDLKCLGGDTNSPLTKRSLYCHANVNIVNSYQRSAEKHAR